MTDKRCNEEMFEKFVGFVLGRFSIVARDRDVQIVGQHVPAQSIDLVQHMLGNVGGVRAFALGKRNGHCGIICARLSVLRHREHGKQDVGVGFGWAVLNLLRHIAQVDGPSGMNPYDDLSQFFGTRKEGACLDLELVIVARKTTGLTAGVRARSCVTIAPGVRP